MAECEFLLCLGMFSQKQSVGKARESSENQWRMQATDPLGGRGRRQNNQVARLRPSSSLQPVGGAASCGILHGSSEWGKGA